MKITVGFIKEQVPSGAIAIRIDRYSVLGNPFELKDEKQRASVCLVYDIWLDSMLKDKGVTVEELCNRYMLTVAPKFKNPTSAQVKSEFNKLVKLAKQSKHLHLLCWCKKKGKENTQCHGEGLAMKILEGRAYD